MDKVAQVTAAMSFNGRVFKEPRGLIKVIQFILAIFAFATTCSVNTYSEVKVECKTNTSLTTTPPQKTYKHHITISYPFRINEYPLKVHQCTKSPVGELKRIYGDFSAPSQFYVFIGVMAFLYCLAALILYVCFDDKYRKFDKIPIADFIVTAVFTVMWLIASSAWAQGVSDLKFYSDPKTIIKHELKQEPMDECNVNTCSSNATGNFASLNVTLIFGFLNMALWGCSLWFLFKETPWHKVTSRPSDEPTTEPQFDSFGGDQYGGNYRPPQPTVGGYQDPTPTAGGYQTSQDGYQ